MTTQVSKGLKAKIDALAEALTLVGREAQPRPGFFVELIRGWEPEDPEGERQAHEVLYFVVNGSEEELRVFDKRVGAAFNELTWAKPKLRASVSMETILVDEAVSAIQS